MPNSNNTRAGKYTCVGLWIVINAVFIATLDRFKPLYQVILVLSCVAALAPGYVVLTHLLDQNFKWLGIRSLNNKIKGAGEVADVFRRTLRLEMLAITSGFSATFLLLSIQLYYDIEGPTPETLADFINLDYFGDESLILAAMMVFFFTASILNLLQIVLYDFRLASRNEKHPAFGEIAVSLRRKLGWFREISWHSLVAPILLSFALINYKLCIALNLMYGLILYCYYFFDGASDAYDIYNSNPPAPDQGPESETAARLTEQLTSIEETAGQLERQIHHVRDTLRTPVTVTIHLLPGDPPH